MFSRKMSLATVIAALAFLAFVPGLASAAGPGGSAVCPQECINYSNNKILEGDQLQIKHLTDAENIAVRLGGSNIGDLAYKNTSPSVQLYASCRTGTNSWDKIGWLSAQVHAACRSHYISIADSLGLTVTYE